MNWNPQRILARIVVSLWFIQFATAAVLILVPGLSPFLQVFLSACILATAAILPIWKWVIQPLQKSNLSQTSELSEQKTYFDSILDSMSEGFVVHDPEGKIVRFNQAACNLLGLTADQLTGRTSVDGSWSCVKEDGSPFPGEEHPSRAVMKNKVEIRNTIMGVNRSDKSTVWIQINCSPLNGDYVLATFADVTTQILRQRSLMESESLLREAKNENEFLMDSLKIGMWKWDIVRNVLVWDDSMYEIFDIPRAKFAGAYEAWESALDPQDKIQATEELQKALRGEKKFDTTFKIRNSKDEILYIGGRGVVVRDGAGAPLKMYGINWDRTNEVKLEQTVEQERARSAQAAKLASLGEMSAGVAHEINNPLAVISGMANLMDAVASDPVKLKARVENINKAITRISKIVNGLKKFSRTNTEKIRKVYSLSTVINEAIWLTEIKAKRFDVKLRISTEAASMVEVDDVEIEQVIVNLINNSIDAIKDSEDRWVEVKTWDEPTKVVLRVTDSGNGISQKYRDKLFDPFFTTKQVGEGTGLGLSVAKGIIEDHGGTLVLRDDVLHTSFEIKFPKYVKTDGEKYAA